MGRWWKVERRHATVGHLEDFEEMLAERGITPDEASKTEGDTETTSDSSENTTGSESDADASSGTSSYPSQMTVPESATVEWADKNVTGERELTVEIPTSLPFFARRHDMMFENESGEVVEQVYASIGMPLLLFSGSLAIVFAQLTSIGALSVLSVTAGVSLFIAGLIAAESARKPLTFTLTPKAVVVQYLGVPLVAGGCLLLLVLLSGVPSAASGVLACLLVSVYIVDETTSARFTGFSSVVSSALRSLPILARLHVGYVGIAICSLGFFVTYTSDITITSVDRIVGWWLLVSFIVATLLVSVHGRDFSRVNVALAVGLTLGTVLLTLFRVELQVTVSSRTPAAGTVAATLALALTLVTIWWSLWIHLSNQTRTATMHFSQRGREVDTRLAGVFAYLSMVTSAMLGLALLFWGWLAWRSLLSGRVDIFVLAIASVLPAAYFVGGGIYQGRAIVSTVRTFRAETTPVEEYDHYHSLMSEIPFTPTHDVWVLDTGGFFAAAYSDPFDSAIILSEGVLDRYGPLEIAVVLAHEESHFDHRGAQLQFYLGLLTVFTLLGKNVVYSIYDFYARELTADEAAVERLRPFDGFDGRIGLVNVLLSQVHSDIEPAKNVPQFFPTLVSVPESLQPHSLLEETFHLFYGQFAGGVHPSPNERLQHVNRTDVNSGE